MNDLLKSFFEGLNKAHSDVMELAAIWMERPVQTGTERTVRLTEGHLIRVEDGKVVDCSNEKNPTHKIIGCYGTVYSTKMGFVLLCLESNEPVNLDL